MTWEQVSALGLELPETAVGVWYRTPSVTVRGKSFVRLKEDGTSVVFLLESVEEQDFLTRASSEVFFITDHYRGYPAVLARLSKLRKGVCRERLRTAWRQKAPKKLLRALDATEAPGSAR